MSLFEGVKSQYIDRRGKMRMLIYESGICLMTPPLPPLKAPFDSTIEEVSLEEARDFIADKNLELVMQDVSGENTQGLWVRSPELLYGYIPIEDAPVISDVRTSPLYLSDPLRTEGESEMETMYRSRKIADFLKQYTLYEYASHPDTFSGNSFVVIPDHDYDIQALDKRLYKEGNDIMYADGRLIVPSDDIRDRLMGFLRVSLLNDTPGVMEYRHRTIIKDYYRTLHDFRKVQGQLVFFSQYSLERWVAEKTTEKDREIVFTYVRPDVTEPYFYRNYNIENGRVAIIQNVESGSLERALRVGEKWAKDKINLGFRAEIRRTIQRISYTVFIELGEHEIVRKDPAEEHVHVMLLYEDYYAALLFI